MASKSRNMAASTIAAQTMELREEPRRFVTSQSSMSPMSPISPISPTKAMVFAADDDDLPDYINDLPYHARDTPYISRAGRESNQRNFNLVRSPSPFSRDSSPPRPTKEMPLRPNRREDIEFGREDSYPVSQVFFPSSTKNRPARKKSSGGNSGKSWLKNIKSPIGESRPYTLVSLLCSSPPIPDMMQ